MTNVGPAAYHLHQQPGLHGYGNHAPGPSFPSPSPLQQYPQSLFSVPQQQPPPQQIYQQFHQQQPQQQQQQRHAYGNFPPQSPAPIGPSTSSTPQPIYTSAPHTQPVTSATIPISLSQPGPPSYSASGPQQTQGMAAPGQPFLTNPMMQQRQTMANGALAQQAQLQNAVQNQIQALPSPSSPSPQSAARERARVSVLLDINTHLLQEVVTLQAQGKAGVPSAQAQHSPTKESATSPTSATDPSHPLNQSPVDPAKPTGGKPPSPEYVECMRRLQANLSYLAAIADAKKKKEGTLPAGPAIMAPPPHLPEVTDLYKKLNALFPNASQSAINKAMAIASAQAVKAQNPVQAHG